MVGKYDRSAWPAAMRRLLQRVLDTDWYAATYPDISTFNGTPAAHFLAHGVRDRRDPSPWFDSAWYLDSSPDVSPGGGVPLLHYLQFGATELRNPAPHFDAVFYTEQHPEAADNPLLFHTVTGHDKGYATEWRVAATDCLPSTLDDLPLPIRVIADIAIQPGTDLPALQRCLTALLTDPGQPLGRVMVLDDGRLPVRTRRWLQTPRIADRVAILSIPHGDNQAAALNLAADAAGRHDLVLLDAAMEVPSGWLSRLAAQAYAHKPIATVSPFANTPTWGGFPHRGGGALPFDLSPVVIDAACRRVNRGRSVIVPLTNRHCVYIRRDALRALGPFGNSATDPDDWDTEFCLRAIRAGWQNRIACDTFVHCARPAAAHLLARDAKRIGALYPDYPSRLMSHQRWDRAGPARYAVVAALMAADGKPVIAMVTHFMGGGVRRQIDMIAERLHGRAHILLLEGWVTEVAYRAFTDMRIALPDRPGGHVVTIAPRQVDDVAAMLRAAGVSRVHVHHLLWFDFDTRTMIRRLGVPFDVTIHDNYVLCPQLNMLPQATSFYCGGPDIATCNACIAISPSANQARDILSWRLRYAWQFVEADRVIVPSHDMKQRLQRFGIGDSARVVPHEPVAKSNWNLVLPKPGKGPLRIVLLGTLANHKGSRIVAPVVETAPKGLLRVHCIGEIEDTFPPEAAALITATGRYREADLAALIAAARAHVIWLPSVAPESYSFTLSAASDAGLPIVATRFGAFPERLEGRPFTWLVAYDSPTEHWIDTFRAVRKALEQAPAKLPKVPRQPVADFYATEYLVDPAAPAGPAINRAAKPVIAVVPERFASGHLSPCAFIRLLQPLTHPDIARAAHRRPADLRPRRRSAGDPAVASGRGRASAEGEGRAAVAGGGGRRVGFHRRPGRPAGAHPRRCARDSERTG